MTRRVLHLIETGGPGGAETVLLEVARGLDESAWRSIVALPYRDWLYGALEAADLEAIVLPQRGSFDLRYLAKLVRIIRRRKIEVVHAHLFTPAVYGGIAGLLTGVPVVATFHGHSDVDASDRFLKVKFRLIDRGRNRLVFVSHRLRNWFESRGYVGRRRTHVVHNGIDFDKGAGKASTIRDDLLIPPDGFLVGAVGNIRPAKGYEVLLEAARRLLDLHESYFFVIVGDTRSETYGRLLAQRTQRGLDGRVFFTGFRDDVWGVLRSLDLFVLSSHTEGFSLATVQALDAGVPIVATRCGGPEELVEDGVTGMLVPAGDPGALSKAIESFRLDPEMRSRLGEAAGRIGRERFSRDRMAREYEGLYAAVIGAPDG